MVVGDNLGLNTLLGFSKGFSATFFCRFCKCTKTETETLGNEKDDKLRTIENYNDDVLTNNITETGIHSESLFNQLPWFHVVHNVSVDVMHDLHEGVCHYNMSHVITHLLLNKHFTLEQLNARKQSFNLGETEVGNQSPAITESHLKNKHFKMSAREMWTFVHHFPLMIGDLVTNHDDKIWVFFITFLKMMDLILLSSFNEESLNQLQILVKDHNEMYVKLFSDTLKPKHHFLTHYARIVKDQGSFYELILKDKIINIDFFSRASQIFVDLSLRIFP